ncbi:MAG: serine/threonine protein kinase, partial [Nocardioides sp.]|nr:serine/threonine protein kinase [Nocardioides sp.]
EYVPGPTLQSAVERHGALPEESVRRLAAGLAEGLLAIHSADVVHRDLKPANVILTSGGPKLLDFGIARALDLTSHTRAEVFGTAAYMSPEQALATPVGPASDVFSLGSTIAYAATGRRIFGEGHPMAVAWRVSECRTDEEVVRAISPRLAAIINACLVREPEQRATPLEVIDLADATGVAHPDDDWLPERPEHADESADAPTMVVDYTPPMQTEAGDVDDDPTIEQLSGELWVWHRTVDEALLAGEPTAVPAALGRFMGLQPGIAREIHAGAFSVGISWSSGIGTMPMLGSIVRLLGAVGAQAGDDIRLRFNRETDVLVVQKATPPDAAETVVRG